MGRDSRRKKRRGQALVEFALFVALFTLLLAGAADLGRGFTALINLRNMARAGAQYGSAAVLLGDTSPTAIRDHMIDAAFKEQPTIYGTAPTVCAWSTTDSEGKWVTVVEVTYDFKPFIQIPPIPSTVTISRTATMRMQFVPPAWSGVSKKCV